MANEVQATVRVAPPLVVIDLVGEVTNFAEDAITVAPITLPAHTSIMTGLYPPAHGVRDNGNYALSDEAVTLAERLKERGFATHAIVSALVLNRKYNLDQGFDAYDDDLYAEDDPPMFMIPDRPAARTAERAVAWLDAHYAQPAPQPFFLWILLLRLHRVFFGRIGLLVRGVVLFRWFLGIALLFYARTRIRPGDGDSRLRVPRWLRWRHGGFLGILLLVAALAGVQFMVRAIARLISKLRNALPAIGRTTFNAARPIGRQREALVAGRRITSHHDPRCIHDDIGMVTDPNC